ncbi:MAG: hypothetical protein H0X22_04305 [Acidimicrobiia bacterium]|nr:hypothetical protein [Acidimicrobiia bacterium]MBA3802113.1 hypothetical protein [Acidimicrobiia bacterium]
MATDKRDRQRQNRALRIEQEIKHERRRSTRGRILKGAGALVAVLAALVGIAWFASRGSDDDIVPATTVPGTLAPGTIAPGTLVPGAPTTVPGSTPSTSPTVTGATTPPTT